MTRRRRRQDTVCRNVLQRCAALASKTQDLACSSHVGSAQRSVRVDQVDSCSRVDDDLSARCEFVEGLDRKTESLAREGTRQDLHTLHDGIAPETKVNQVATDARDTRWNIGLRWITETDKTDDLGRSVLQKIVKQESAEETSRTSQEDGVCVLRSVHFGSRDGLYVLVENGVPAQGSGQI